MPSYFRQVPNFDYVSRLPNANIGDYITVKNIFKNGFDRYVLNKYGDYNTLYNGIHHYETTEVTNSQGVIMVPGGLEVPVDYSIDYYDYFIDTPVKAENITIPVTNYEYEEKMENDKRNIFVLKPFYLNIVLNDMGDIMPYKKGSSQYVSETLKKADNIRLTS